MIFLSQLTCTVFSLKLILLGTAVFLKTLSLFAFKLNCSLLKYFKSENKM
jgi:hypothetical protein